MIDNPPKPAREQYRRFRAKATKDGLSRTKLEIVNLIASEEGYDPDFGGRGVEASAAYIADRLTRSRQGQRRRLKGSIGKRAIQVALSGLVNGGFLERQPVDAGGPFRYCVKLDDDLAEAEGAWLKHYAAKCPEILGKTTKTKAEDAHIEPEPEPVRVNPAVRRRVVKARRAADHAGSASIAADLRAALNGLHDGTVSEAEALAMVDNFERSRAPKPTPTTEAPLPDWGAAANIQAMAGRDALHTEPPTLAAATQSEPE